jgi:hypothetical protein
MRTFLAFGGFALMLCFASLVEAQGQGSSTAKGQGDVHKSTGKTLTSPGTGKKTDNTHIITKGSTTFHSTDHKGVNQTKKPPSKDHHTYAAQLKTSINSGNLKLTPAQSTALDKLTSQQPLTADDRQQLSDLLFNGQQAGLSSADETALSYLLTDDLARNDETPASTPRPASTGPMYLRVLNKTTEPIKVWVQVIDHEASPSNADKSAKPDVLRYDLQAGKAYDLHNKGERLAASTIRIWAMSPTRQWASNRDQDLPLTSANASKVFTVTFAPPTTAQAGSDGPHATSVNR